MSTRSRYPGAKPFETAEQDIFFGRDQDVVALKRKIKLAPLTVLYGKSGYGKSSLLNAGLIPVLSEESSFVCLRVRFNAYQSERTSIAPLETTKSVLATVSQSNHLANIIEEDDSLWRRNKEFYVDNEGEKGLLLVFDQFEELFTYPAEELLLFRQQLAEVLYNAVPQRYWDRWDELQADANSSPLHEETLALFQDNPNIRVVFAIRSDRLHLLEKLSDYLPLILNNLQELGPLSDTTARKAIIEPAYRTGAFISPRFTYESEALDNIIQFLTDKGTEVIESTQLQIVCHHLERKILATDAYEITPEDVNDLAKVIEDYYEERLSLISESEQRLAAQKLIEEGLIFEEEERRLSIYEGQALKTFNLSAETLRLLVDSHLLRAEASMRGGYTYELSHDTLVPPVLKTKRIRKAAEAELTKKQLLEEQNRILKAEKRKRQRAYLLAIIGIALATITTVAAVIAYRKSQQTERARIELAILLAENWKVQGNYLSAIATIENAIKFAPNGEHMPQLEKRLVKWQEIYKLTEQADSLALMEAWYPAIQLLEQANSISSDTFLVQKRQAAIASRDELVKRLVKQAEGQVFIDQIDFAKSIYDRIIQLDPDNENIKQRIKKLSQ